MKNELFLLGIIATVSAASLHAASIAINSTNFSVTNTGAPVPSVSNTYTANTSAVGHVGLQYQGGTDFLNSDQRFTLTFNYTGGANPTGGAAFWFGTSSAANWVFVNEEDGATNDLLRNFTTRNLQAHSGSGTVTTTTISDASMAPSTTYTLTLDRILTGGNYFLQNIQVRNPSNAVIGSLADVNVGTDAAWGVTIFAPAAFGNVTSTTTTISGLDVSAIPEPSSAALLAISLLLAVRRRRPTH